MKTKRFQTGSGCLTLFALPFAGVGVFMTVWTARSIRDAYRVARWREVPATIVEADLRTSSDSDGSAYEAGASYRYEVNGSLYAGRRVSIHSGGDNIGRFQREAYQELKRHQESGEPFRCYIDPHDPAESILYRNPRWEMIGFKALFGFLFGGAGFGLMAAGLYGRRRQRAEAEAKARCPNAPWLWNPDWATGAIKSSSKIEMLAALLFAGAWNAIAFPIALVFLGRPRDGHGAVACLILIFPLAGLFLAIWAVRAVLRYRAYGVSIFRMSKVPGVIGGTVAGAVEVPGRLRPLHGFRVALRCVRRYSSGDSTSEETLWEDVRVIVHEIAQGPASRSAIPILFAVPRNCRPSDSQNQGDRIVWRLEVEAQTRGFRYQSRFEIPVFVTPESSDNVQPDAGFAARYEETLDPLQVMRENGMIIRPIPGGIRYLFPAARHKGSAAMLTAFCAVWSGIVAALWKSSAPRVLAAVFTIVDLLVFLGLLSAWFRWRQIEIRARDVTLTSGMLGFSRRRVLQREEAEDVVAEMSSQSGARTIYRLKLRARGGRSYTIGTGILGKHTADLVAGEIKMTIAG